MKHTKLQAIIQGFCATCVFIPQCVYYRHDLLLSNRPLIFLKFTQNLKRNAVQVIREPSLSKIPPSFEDVDPFLVLKIKLKDTFE